MVAIQWVALLAVVAAPWAISWRKGLAGAIWESLYNNKLLAVELAAILGIVYGAVGASNGIPALFWFEGPRDGPWWEWGWFTQGAAGGSVVLLVVLLFYVIYIADGDRRRAWGEAHPEVPPGLARLWSYLTWMSAPFLIIAALPAVLPHFRPGFPADPGRSPLVLGGFLSWPWLVGMGAGLIVVAALASWRVFQRIHWWAQHGLGRTQWTLEHYLEAAPAVSDPRNLLALFAAIYGTSYFMDELLAKVSGAAGTPPQWGPALLAILGALIVLAFLLPFVGELVMVLFWASAGLIAWVGGRPWRRLLVFAVGLVLAYVALSDPIAAAVLGLAAAAALTVAWLLALRLGRARFDRVFARSLADGLVLIYGATVAVLAVDLAAFAVRGRLLYVFEFRAAFVICLALGMVAAMYAFLSVQERIWQIWVAALVPMVLLIHGSEPYKLHVPGLERYYPARWYRRAYQGRDPLFGGAGPVDLAALPGGEPPRNPALLDSSAVLVAWAARREGEDKPKLAIVTTSGGAIRSAAWTAAALGTIEGRIPEFRRDLRLITGASGGMLGAAAYVTSLHDRETLREGAEKYHRTLARDLVHGQDILSPVIARMIMRDLPGVFCWYRQTRDRGDVLEESWRAATRDRLKVSFVQLRPWEQAGRLPSLVFSPLMLEDGRRLLISNLDLSRYASARGGLIGGGGPTEAPYSRSAVQLFDLFPEATEFRVETAVRLNATFPFVSPSVPLPTRPIRRIFDAGGYDNYGVNLAARWVAEHAEWIAANTSGVALIQLRAFANEGGLRDLARDVAHGLAQAPAPAEGPPPEFRREFGGALGRGLQFLTSPADVVNSARPAINYYRNDEQAEALSAWFRAQTGDAQFFETVIFTCYEEDPPPAATGRGAGEPAAEAAAAKQRQVREAHAETLSWTIGASEEADILGGMSRERNAKRLAELAAWWRTPHGPARGR